MEYLRNESNIGSLKTRLMQVLGDGPLCGAQKTPLCVSVLTDDPDALLLRLSEGTPIPLLDRAAESAEETEGVRLDCAPDALEGLLSPMALEDRAGRLTEGWSGLCLAQGTLSLTQGLQGPVLLWPIRLEQVQEQWQMTPGSESPLLNYPLLSTLPAPEEGWSPNWEPLSQQLQAVLSEEDRLENALVLSRLPLFALELAQKEDVSLPVPAEECAAPDAGVCTGEEALLSPLPLSGEQMAALRHLGEEKPLLVSGGHGTGKTQLLAGLMANATGAGQRVLVVSPRSADLEGAYARMQELGLDTLCLHIPADGDRKQAVLRQYNVAALRRPASLQDDYFSLSQRAARLSGKLDRYVSTLHNPSRCGLSPYELITRYLAVAHTKGALSLPLPMISQLDGTALQELIDAADALADSVAPLGSPANHPLELILQWSDTEDLSTKLEAQSAALLAAVNQLEQSGSEWCGCSGMSMPEQKGDWDTVAEAARLLLDWQDYPPQWASSTRIPMLLEAVQELRKRLENAERLQEKIRETWDDSVFGMDAPALEQQWKFLQEDWTLPSEPARERNLRQYLAQAEPLLAELETVGRKWAKLLQIPAPDTRDSWERSYEVALELARWKEIPADWGSCSNLEALLSDVGDLLDYGRQAKDCKEVLLRDWTEDFLKLKGEPLLARWQKEGGSWGIGWLKRQSPLRTELAPYCKSQLTTDLLENGLRWLVNYQQNLAECDEIYSRWPRELSSVYRREDTVWLWLDTARVVAAESHDWLAELTGSEDFLMRYGSNPEAILAADALQAQWEKARELLGRMDVLIGRTNQPDSPDWVVARRADCRRLRNLLNIRKQMEACAKVEVPLGQLAEQLHRINEHQKERAAIAALYTRWQEELEGLYTGPTTDWESLRTLSIEAVQSDNDLSDLTGDLELRSRLAGTEEAMNCATALLEAKTQLEMELERFQELVSIRLFTQEEPWLNALRSACETLLAHMDQLDAWMNYLKQSRRCEELGLSPFVEELLRPEADIEDPKPLFYKSIYRALLQMELDWTPELRQFSARQFSELLRQYDQLEEQLMEGTRQELYYLGSARIPELSRQEELQEEFALLRWANQTGALDISLEELLRNLPQLTRALFPCVLASPADALRCFGGDAPDFDYIAVDSADRLPAAVGARVLAMGKTPLLLCRGEKLPASLLSDGISLFDACAQHGMPVQARTRSYLPRPEGLQWLEDRYGSGVGLPTPLRDRTCFREQTVVGLLSHQRNSAEAAAVSAQAISLYRKGRRDFAVAALTLAQAELIRSLLEGAAREDAALAALPEEVPVLSPESAGGLRRKNLLLSLTLAADASGYLNDARRILKAMDPAAALLSLIAAAEENICLFTSLDPSDRRNLEQDYPVLRDLLALAEWEHLPPREPEDFRDALQQEICLALREAGYHAVPGPAPIDLSVSRLDAPERPVLGILMDNTAYRSIPRTRERELDRTQLLQAQGWNLCRLWAMDWLQDRKRVTAQILRLLDLLQQQSEEPEEEAPAPAQEAPLYRPAQISALPIRSNELLNPTLQNRIYRGVEQILEQEAPMSLNQLTVRALTAFGLDAQDPTLQERAETLWRKSGLRITPEDNACYVWRPDQDPDRLRMFRRSGTGEAYRAPEDVSCQEGANAACAALRKLVTLTSHQLAAETARMLGYDPADEAALHCGERGVECAVFQGRVQEFATGCLTLDRRIR